MIAMTTSSSISVKAGRGGLRRFLMGVSPVENTDGLRKEVKPAGPPRRAQTICAASRTTHRLRRTAGERGYRTPDCGVAQVRITPHATSGVAVCQVIFCRTSHY